MALLNLQFRVTFFVKLCNKTLIYVVKEFSLKYQRLVKVLDLFFFLKILSNQLFKQNKFIVSLFFLRLVSLFLLQFF